MAGSVYKLRSRIIGMLYDGNQRRLVVIPTNAVVTIIEGDLGGRGYVTVRYHEHEIEVFALDLRERGESASEQSA